MYILCGESLKVLNRVCRDGYCRAVSSVCPSSSDTLGRHLERSNRWTEPGGGKLGSPFRMGSPVGAAPPGTPEPKGGESGGGRCAMRLPLSHSSKNCISKEKISSLFYPNVIQKNSWVTWTIVTPEVSPLFIN